MRFCDFFAGIGGFRLGLERAGHRCVWSCEIDDFCRKIYAQHFEEPQGKDINNVKAEEIPEAELWCGGFPCQDLSVAGKRGGLQANRSGLYWTWYELIRKHRPPWLLIENVPGLLSSKGGADFALILSSLDSIGYGVAWRVLDAQFFGLAQRRKRVFIVGRFGKPCPPEILFEREGGKGNPSAKREAGREIAASVEGCANNEGGLQTPVVSPLATSFGHHGWGLGDEDIKGGKVVVGTIAGGSGKRGWSVSAEGARDGYLIVTPPPDAEGMREATGLSRRLDTPDNPRYKALGNAVAVPVIEWIGRRLPK
jgi:DNA (cytosine-5)-methyltransferase 1